MYITNFSLIYHIAPLYRTLGIQDISELKIFLITNTSIVPLSMKKKL